MAFSYPEARKGLSEKIQHKKFRCLYCGLLGSGYATWILSLFTTTHPNRRLNQEREILALWLLAFISHPMVLKISHLGVMDTLFLPRLLCTTLLGSALALSTATLNAIDLVEEFDGVALDTAVWESGGAKTASLTAGHLEINADGGDWANYNIRSEQRFFVPPAGETSIFEWVLAPGSITTDAGQSIRYQIGIVSNNETNTNPEHFPNSTGGLWIDLDNIQNSDTANVVGSTVTADDQKTANDNGVTTGISVPWNWQTENKTLRLELTSDTFKWMDGTTVLTEETLANVGIDNEFGNGFRVIALGMNFDTGRGTTAYESISVTNGSVPVGLLQSFSSTRPSVFSGQKIELNWLMDADASASIDQEIGNVDGQTAAGTGSISFISPPDITEPTTVTYTITVTKAGEEDSTRQVSVDIVPTPELSLDDISDDFSTNTIDPATWIVAGPIANTVANSVVTWDTAGGGNWSHGELDSQKVFPIPPPGEASTITWNLGPAVVSANSVNNELRGNRPVMGIISAFESETYTLQHYQNTTGGLWMDIANMSNADKTSASGEFHQADDTKIKNQNASTLAGFTISDWNWETEDREFSLVLSNTGYTWMDGTTELATGTYTDAGLDTGPGGEFSKGFRIMFAAVKYEDGSGTMSLNSVNFDNNGIAPPSPL
ncbi:hypothetical protein N9Z88_05575, partial [Akkermansiaceae bacterium]|nr:hypothetical protein [Akkermansiaceae bacterium]